MFGFVIRNFFFLLLTNEMNDFYLDVFPIGAVHVENDATLMASSRAVAADDAFAKTDTLVGHDELVENVFAVSNSVFDDTFLQRMAAADEAVEDGHTISQSRTAHRDLTGIDTVLDGSFQDGQTDILMAVN